MKPEEAPPPPLEYFRCPKGHETIGEQSWNMTSQDPLAPRYDTGPLCMVCLFAWFTLTFGTQRIAPPQSAKPPAPPKKKGKHGKHRPAN